MNKSTLIDLFAGCGGLSYGFTKAGYKTLSFVEHWEPAVQTFIKNHPDAKHLGKDIKKLRNKELFQYKNKAEVIIGDPP